VECWAFVKPGDCSSSFFKAGVNEKEEDLTYNKCVVERLLPVEEEEEEEEEVMEGTVWGFSILWDSEMRRFSIYGKKLCKGVITLCKRRVAVDRVPGGFPILLHRRKVLQVLLLLLLLLPLSVFSALPLSSWSFPLGICIKCFFFFFFFS
jgi:hypothetical protein